MVRKRRGSARPLKAENHGDYYNRVFNVMPYDEMLAYNGQQWISCDERLPEYGVNVLFHEKGKGEFLGRIFCSRIHQEVGGVRTRMEFDWYYVGVREQRYTGEISPDSNVTHWMPLPAPPREDIQPQKEDTPK